MNKQELIERMEDLKNLFGNKSEYVKIDTVIELISELDEPQKVKVPQFVADWIEECKAKEKNLLKSLLYTPEGVNSWVDNSDNQEIFALAWIFGYEVEEEKRYYVRFKGMESNDFNYLNFIRFQRAWVLSSLKIDKKFRTAHTRKELEDAGFGWVFDCEGIDIEEVE